MVIRDTSQVKISIDKNIMFLKGKAGTGKTEKALELAKTAIDNKEVVLYLNFEENPFERFEEKFSESFGNGFNIINQPFLTFEQIESFIQEVKPNYLFIDSIDRMKEVYIIEGLMGFLLNLPVNIIATEKEKDNYKCL